MGKAVEFGIKKKRATQAALGAEILVHRTHGAVRALSLELVPLTDQKEIQLRSRILSSGESALLSMADLRMLTKSESRALKGKLLTEINDALREHIATQATRLEFSDLILLHPFTIDDSGDEYIKVGNTSAIRAPIVRGTSLFVRLEDERTETEYAKVRFSKSQRVTLITL